jgi:hypothetical protein
VNQQLGRLYTATTHDAGQQELADRVNPSLDPTHRPAFLLVITFHILFAE